MKPPPVALALLLSLAAALTIAPRVMPPLRVETADGAARALDQCAGYVRLHLLLGSAGAFREFIERDRCGRLLGLSSGVR